jgi:hypothetical protein
LALLATAKPLTTNNRPAAPFGVSFKSSGNAFTEGNSGYDEILASRGHRSSVHRQRKVRMRAGSYFGEPGAYAFYHPDGDVLRTGSSVYRPQAEPYRTGYSGAMASATIGRSARGHKRRQQ